MVKHSWIVGILFAQISLPLLAVDQREAQSTEVTNSAVDSGLETDMLFLRVDKTDLRADLMTWPSEMKQSETLISFRIAIGKEEGDKQVEGDNKTPEGIYFAQELIDGKTLPAKYGPFAIPINFPNPHDRSLGKTGYGIWLHGVEKDARIEEANVTEGCVAFYNADIVALSSWLKPQQSVIVITNRAEEANRQEDVSEILSHTKNWYSAWKKREIQDYLGYYHERFRYRGMKLGGFAKYKERVFKQYDEMNVAVRDVRVFTHKNYAISVFNQDFNGDDRYVSNGRKVLYWERQSDGEWRITHEIFESKRFELQKYSRDLLARLSKESPSFKQFSKENIQSSSL
ncbi:MAG: L,D-transpeptidase family protein [Oligoflexus sp.]